MSDSDPYRLPSKPTIIPVRTLKQNPDLLQTPVAQISIIGTETSEADGVFHFRMSLVLSDKKVIRLDASPAFTDPSHMSRGYVLLEYDPELEPAGPAVFTVKVAHPEVTLTAAHICKALFNDNAQDQYDFNDDGNGCRHWCAVSLDKLAEAGYITSTVGPDFRAYEDQEHAKFGTTRFPMPRIQGSFYA
ncbi:hypothetical protein B0H14DRAFT_3137764 [Mycena olivaceomarginata]|nr:hypothetical protein B0H14DRAFT_3137764 [Mycena olivaceomarginata]